MQLSNEFSREVVSRFESMSGLATKLSEEEQSNLKVDYVVLASKPFNYEFSNRTTVVSQ